MERKLIDDLVDLELHIESVSKATLQVRSILNSLLSAQDKSFEVTFNGKIYDFYYPVTSHEADTLRLLRNELIDKVILVSFETGNWDYALAFASGVDPKDMQCEVIKHEDIYPVADSNGDKVAALPLDEDAYVVRNERLKEDYEHIYENQDLDYK